MNKKRMIAMGIGTTNHSLFWIGLAIVSVGVFIVFPYRKDKKP